MHYKNLLLAAVLVSTNFVIKAQSQEKIYSALILNFARGIQWPASAGGADFVTGVLSYEPLADELKAQAEKIRVGNRKIVVQEYSSPEDVGQCHILFIPSFKGKNLSLILEKIKFYPTLIITNKPGSALQGSGVNLVMIEGKLRYEINSKSIEKRGMKISANVKGMGIVVE